MHASPYADQVLTVVELIPRGFVMSYGDIAEYVGVGGPRQVGAAMAAFGGAVAWWRVVRADGTPPHASDGEALRRLRDERVPMRARGDRVDMRRARWAGESAFAL